MEHNWPDHLLIYNKRLVPDFKTHKIVWMALSNVPDILNFLGSMVLIYCNRWPFNYYNVNMVLLVFFTEFWCHCLCSWSWPCTLKLGFCLAFGRVLYFYYSIVWCDLVTSIYKRLVCIHFGPKCMYFGPQKNWNEKLYFGPQKRIFGKPQNYYYAPE